MADPPSAPPRLTDGVVTLREPLDSDVDAMARACEDPEMLRWTGAGVGIGEAGARIERIRRGWADGTRFGWIVSDAAHPGFAGQLDLGPGPPPAVGYSLAPWARGAGRMTRALRLAADWGFDVLGFQALQWNCRTGNVASWRVAHACGFRFEGVRTLALPDGDGLVDAWSAVLLPGRPIADRTPCTTWLTAAELTGDRVRLRAPVEADLDRLVETCDDPETLWWSATLPRPYTHDDGRRRLRDIPLEASLGQSLTWTVADRDDDRFLATVSLFGLDRPYTPTGGEIGYRAHPDARGRGAVSEAVRLLVEHAFTPADRGGLGRTRLQIGASAENTASRRVARRAGFRLWGEARGDGVHGLAGEIVDDGVWYELLATDPRPGAPGTVGGPA